MEKKGGKTTRKDWGGSPVYIAEREDLRLVRPKGKFVRRGGKKKPKHGLGSHKALRTCVSSWDVRGRYPQETKQKTHGGMGRGLRAKKRKGKTVFLWGKLRMSCT